MTKTASPLQSCKSTGDQAIEQASSSQQAQSSKTKANYQDSKPEGSSQNKKHDVSSRTSQNTGGHPATSSQNIQTSTTNKDLVEENSKTSKPAQEVDVFSDEEHQEFSKWLNNEFDWGPL